MERIWIDGRPVEPGEGGISPLDRGFTLGDGIFETMRARDGRVFAWNRHLARLIRGATVLGLAFPTPADIEHHVATALADAPPGVWATLRLSISRGVPRRRGLLPDAACKPTVVIHRSPLAPYPDRVYHVGMTAITSRIRRNEYSPLATIKSLSYLDNVVARQEAAARGADEALLLNTSGHVAGASAMNLFLVFGTTLVTPPMASGALPGTVRGLILDRLAREAHLDAVEMSVRPTDLFTSDEAFLTNALAGVVPLTRVDERSIGGRGNGAGRNPGPPGVWTRRLIASVIAAWQTCDSPTVEGS